VRISLGNNKVNQDDDTEMPRAGNSTQGTGIFRRMMLPKAVPGNLFMFEIDRTRQSRVGGKFDPDAADAKGRFNQHGDTVAVI
jgi:hypothetical protein